MAELKKPKTGGEVFDVAKPGKSAPSSTSKSIIINHHPILKDPMVVDDAGAKEDDKPTPEAPLKPTSKLKISPITLQPTDSPEPETPETDAENPAVDEPTEEAATTEEAKEPEAEEKSSESFSSDDITQKKSDEPSEAAKKKEAERAAELEKLVDSHKYYLPINQEKRRNTRNTLLGVFFIVILGLAWADVALDAGIITIHGIKAPTHFFH